MLHGEVLVGSHRRGTGIGTASTVPKVATQAAAAKHAEQATVLAPAIGALIRQVRASSRGRPERGRSPEATWGPLLPLAEAGLFAQRRAIECAAAACGAEPDDQDLFLRWAGVRGVPETFEQLAVASPRPLAVRTIRLRVANVRKRLPGALAGIMPVALPASPGRAPGSQRTTVRDLTLTEFQADRRTAGQERLLREAVRLARVHVRAHGSIRLGAVSGAPEDSSERTLEALALLAHELLDEAVPDDLFRRLHDLPPNGRWRLRRRGWAALTAVQPALLRRPPPLGRLSPRPRWEPPPLSIVAVDGLAAAAMTVRSGADDHEQAIEAVESLVSAGHPLAELAIDLLAPEVFEPQRVGREFALRARRLTLGVMARAGRPDAVTHYGAVMALAPAGCDEALAATIDVAIHQVLTGEANRAAGELGQQLRGLAGRRQPLDPFVAYYLYLWAAEVCERADSPSSGRDAARDGLLRRARVLADELQDQHVRAMEIARVEALFRLRTKGPGKALDLLSGAADRWLGSGPWPTRPGLFHTAALGCRAALMCGDVEHFRRFAIELSALLGPPGRTPALASAAASVLDQGERRFDWRP